MTYDFWIMASIMELVEYPDETSDDYIAQPTLQTIMNVLEIQVPIAEIYERYFGQSIHTGHVLVFANKRDHMSVWYLILNEIRSINWI